MKSNLSPIEELRAERAALKKEIEVHEAKLIENISYAKDNWVSLLFSSFLPKSTGGLKSIFGVSSQKEGGGFDPSFLLDKLMMVAPFAWKIIQPLLLGLMTKKVSSFFFGKKNKK